MILKRIFQRLAEMRTPECKKEKHERVDNWIRRRRACPTNKEKMDEFVSPFVDPVLRELLEPERLRQRAEMLKAIDRVCMLIQGSGPSATERGR